MNLYKFFGSIFRHYEIILIIEKFKFFRNNNFRNKNNFIIFRNSEKSSKKNVHTHTFLVYFFEATKF